MNRGFTEMYFEFNFKLDKHSGKIKRLHKTVLESIGWILYEMKVFLLGDAFEELCYFVDILFTSLVILGSSRST